jgi:hypothetical protein
MYAQPKKTEVPTKSPRQAFMKFDMDGNTLNYDAKDLETYNILQNETSETKASSVFECNVQILSTAQWRMEIEIRVPPKTTPVVCKMPYSENTFPKGGQQDSYIPSAALYLIDKEASHLYQTEFLNTGNFAITNVEYGWIEGTFDADLPSSLGHDNVKITNGTFRFKLPKQLMARD